MSKKIGQRFCVTDAIRVEDGIPPRERDERVDNNEAMKTMAGGSVLVALGGGGPTAAAWWWRWLGIGF
jgi:hypothetical protein